MFTLLIILQHPEYDLGEGLTPNDIAVVQATTDISGTNIVPGTIAPDPTNPERLGWITGWGRTCGTQKQIHTFAKQIIHSQAKWM